MATKYRQRKIGPEAGLLQVNANEVMERWRHFPVVYNGTGPNQYRVTEDVPGGLQANLANAEQYISVIGSLVTLLLAARIGLKLIASHPGTPSCRFVNYLTDLLLRPFADMTETISSPNIALLELSSLTAVIVYPFATWGLIKLLHYVSLLYVR